MWVLFDAASQLLSSSGLTMHKEPSQISFDLQSNAMSRNDMDFSNLHFRKIGNQNREKPTAHMRAQKRTQCLYQSSWASL